MSFWQTRDLALAHPLPQPIVTAVNETIQRIDEARPEIERAQEIVTATGRKAWTHDHTFAAAAQIREGNRALEHAGESFTQIKPFVTPESAFDARGAARGLRNTYTTLTEPGSGYDFVRVSAMQLAETASGARADLVRILEASTRLAR